MKGLITLTRSFVGALSVALMATAVSAQDEIKRPPLLVPEIANTALQLVPPGWRADEAPIEVDLNGDGGADAAMVIAHGGIGAPAQEPLVTVKHVLVLALRGTDGKLHRSIVSDGAVLDGDEGGVFGDPFDGLSVVAGTVVITHYGGSRERWGYTHKYRYQNGQWMLIGLNFGNTDTFNLEHYDNHDINLITGSAEATQKGDYDDRPRKPEISGSYYELEVLPVDTAPRIGAGNDEWPGYTLGLSQKFQVLRNRPRWRGAKDLSAHLHAVRFGADLFVAAQVTDNEVGPGDVVRLVTRRGLVIKPLESKMKPTANGYVFEARYSLVTIAKASKPDEYELEALQSLVTSSDGANDLEGLELPVAVEIVDVDRSAVPRVRSVLSTRLAGSPYNGAIRIFHKGTLVLVSDITQ